MSCISTCGSGKSIYAYLLYFVTLYSSFITDSHKPAQSNFEPMFNDTNMKVT